MHTNILSIGLRIVYSVYTVCRHELLLNSKLREKNVMIRKIVVKIQHSETES